MSKFERNYGKFFPKMWKIWTNFGEISAKIFHFLIFSFSKNYEQNPNKTENISTPANEKGKSKNFSPNKPEKPVHPLKPFRVRAPMSDDAGPEH